VSGKPTREEFSPENALPYRIAYFTYRPPHGVPNGIKPGRKYCVINLRTGEKTRFKKAFGPHIGHTYAFDTLKEARDCALDASTKFLCALAARNNYKAPCPVCDTEEPLGETGCTECGSTSLTQMLCDAVRQKPMPLREACGKHV